MKVCYMQVKLCLSYYGRTQAKSVQEQGAEEDTCAKEGCGNRKIEKIE